ncbi:MAG: hypothetical protein HUJ73_04250 [Eubacterium sp.]|nr:hypothetical protein [Eubacterium sp.]
MIKANEWLKELIRGHLSADEQQLFDAYVGMVETTIGRNVPVMTPELYGDDPLRVLAEDYCELPVDALSVKGGLPYLRYILPDDCFDYQIRKKLFLYNMAHAVTAYLAAPRKIRLLCDAISETDIRYVVLRCMTEISQALSMEYSEDLKGIIDFSHELLYRFGNRKLGIAVQRLGQEPTRKLLADDRLVGPALLCLKNHVTPSFLMVGIAAGYTYDDPDDPGSAEIQAAIRRFGIAYAIEQYSGIGKDSPLSESVLTYYQMLKEGRPLKEITAAAEYAGWGTV